MTDKQVWLITGAGRWLGVEIAKAALAAGHAVVATRRDPQKVATAIGEHDDLLALRLDVTRPEDSQAAMAATVERFGRLDVLVNNAGNFHAGFFEGLSAEQVRDQLETLLFGPMNVVRTALPVMRKQRAGLLITISSTAGIAGGTSVQRVPPRNSASKGGSNLSPSKSRPSASARCSSNLVFSGPTCSRRDPPPMRPPPLTTTRNGPGKRSRLGTARTAIKAEIPQSLRVH